MSTSDLTPTVVLVHGAFVDASSWNGVIAELKAAGLDVVAPPNLLRGVGVGVGVGVDAAYLTGFVEALGRRVVLVAHSYALTSACITAGTRTIAYLTILSGRLAAGVRSPAA
jgi:pimeloyl-ACP methyl ester carboxylesterase